VNFLARFCSDPREIHFDAAYQVLCYVAGTLDLGITYTDEHPITRDNKGVCHAVNLQIYSDADFASCMKSRKSISAHTVLLCNGAVLWYSKKQTITATSTAESEYISIFECCKTAIWMRNLLTSFNIDLPIINIHTDSQAAMAIASNEDVGGRMKHVDVKYHFIRDLITSKKVMLTYIKTDQMIADVLTKALPAAAFKQHITNMGMI
jgi:hypothetical protein